MAAPLGPLPAIALGSDHAGVTLRGALAGHLRGMGYVLHEVGPLAAEQPADYTEPTREVTRLVTTGVCGRGILICGTGLGVSMAANYVPGIRAALCCHAYTAAMARSHNDANVLCLGARVLGTGAATYLVDVFLSTTFAGGRHAARLQRLETMRKEFACTPQPP